MAKHKNKPKLKRDYRAEYRRRIERGTAKGLSLSQARGHPKVNEKHVKKSRPINEDAFQISLKSLRSGKSLLEAAREIHVSPERLRNQAKALGVIRKQGRRWTVKKSLPRKMLIYSNGQPISITLSKFHYASKAGRYMSAVKRFLRSNDVIHLKPFIGKSVKDSRNKNYVFETNPNALYRITASESESFEQVYRIVI